MKIRGLEDEKPLPALTVHELWLPLLSVIITLHLPLSLRSISPTLHPTLDPGGWPLWMEFPGLPCPLGSGLNQPKGGLGRRSDGGRIERYWQQYHASAHTQPASRLPSTEGAFAGSGNTMPPPSLDSSDHGVVMTFCCCYPWSLSFVGSLIPAHAPRKGPSIKSLAL